FFQQREEYASAEAITLTTGTLVVVKNILVAVGVVGSTSEVTYSLAQSYMNWLDENNTEQAQKIRAMTPVSCDTPGCIEEEQLKEAYKYKAKLQSGEITLPSVPTVQKVSLGVTDVTCNSLYTYQEFIRLDSSTDPYNYIGNYKFNTVGIYKLCVSSLKSGQYGTDRYFFNVTRIGQSLSLFSKVNRDWEDYYLCFNFYDVDGTTKLRYGSSGTDTIPQYFNVGTTRFAKDFCHSAKFHDTFSLDIEYLGEGVANVDGSLNVEKEITPDDITYPDSTIPTADSGSICINVPDSIANSWDSAATPDVIDSDTSALQNANGDTWDYDNGWVDLGINGLLKDIINAIKQIGKDVFDNFEESLNSIANGISDLIDSVNGIAKNICDSLGLTGLFDNVISAINSISFDDIINAIKSLTWSDVVNAIISLPSAIWQFFDSILNDILQAIKDLITLLKQLLIELFVPSDTYFREHFDDLREQLKPYMSVDDFNNIFNKEYSSGDVQDYYFYFMGSKICIPLSLYNNIKSTVLPWIRGIMYFLLVLFNLKSIYSIVRGGSLMKDLNTIDNAVNGRVGGVD
ncbi:MAG: hypothetical protein MR841_07825, partial [Lactobacillus johnsonii]|nr:hypothetical protein [Lactobacillus johnsonii]